LIDFYNEITASCAGLGNFYLSFCFYNSLIFIYTATLLLKDLENVLNYQKEEIEKLKKTRQIIHGK